MNVGIILAAGLSQRFQSTVHKQYLKLNGKEVIYYSIDGMRRAGCFDAIFAVVDADEYEAKYIEKKYNIPTIEGGFTRNESIKNALDYVKNNVGGIEHIVFQDCSRPFVTPEQYLNVVNNLDKHDAVCTTADITDSLVTLDGKFVNRRDYNLIQTPEGFKFDKLYDAFDSTKKDTAIVNQLHDKAHTLFYKSQSFNFKITYPQDLFLAEQLMRFDFVRTNINDKKYLKKDIGKVLLLGGGGGVGTAIRNRLDEIGVTYYSPNHIELNLYQVKVEDIKKACPFEPDVIINVAAAYAGDDAGLIETYDMIFDVNLRSNFVLIEYAKTIHKPVHIVVMSSSSSTRGRENLTNYSAAKAALNSIVESQGAVLHEQGIYINAVIPEKINTPLIAKLHRTNINTRELLDADEVIDTVLNCAVTDEYGKLIHIRKGL